MDTNRPEGFLRSLVGRFQDAVGSLAGDAPAQVRGKADQAAEQVQDAYGEILDYVEHVASSRPLLAVTAGVGIGFVLGVLVARR